MRERGGAHLVLLLSASGLAACSGVVNPGGAGDGAAVPGCASVVDGVLAADELPLRVNATATFVRNAPGTRVPFEPDGAGGADGPVWDLREGPAEAGGPAPVVPIEGSDYEGIAPAATHAAVLAAERPDLATLLRRDERGLVALGLASADGATRLLYDEPLVLAPPRLAVGDAWGQRATFRDARLAGAPNAGVEDWSFAIAARGEALLPGGTRVRDVLAVRSVVTRRLAAAPWPEGEETRHALQLLGPCVGLIASAEGSDADLRDVDVLRRLRP